MVETNSLVNFSRLSLEDRARLAVREAQAEMSPRWVEVMRTLSPARKLANANALFLAARDALYFQERRNGLDEKSARLKAAQRLLMSHDRA
jgi:hypothetical protein